MEIREFRFKAIIEPGAKENAIERFDEARHAYIIKIRAPAQDNKANKELIRFLSKEIGKRVQIGSGLHSREKIIQVKI